MAKTGPIAREFDESPEDGREYRAGQPVGTRLLLRHLAITERAMVSTQNSGERRMLVADGCGVSEARARRLIKSVQHLWKLRAHAFGAPSRARVRLMPLAEAVYAKALESGNLTAALGAIRLQAELCGLRGQDVQSLPSTDAPLRAAIAPETADVAERVLSRLLAYGAHGTNGHRGNDRAQA
jgi:hypothetical protein